MKSTGIQWADDTVNPTSGCDGCELWIPGRGGPCYAGNFHESRLAKTLPALYDPVFSNVRTIPGRIAKSLRCMDLTGKPRSDKPWLDGLRRKIFVGDLGDIFSTGISFEYIKSEIFDNAITKDGSRHDLLLLTKQPKRALKFSEWLRTTGMAWPSNIWIGTSITSRNSLSRIADLVQIPATIKFLSLEPLVADPGLVASVIFMVDWVIIGGESDQNDHKARPFDLEWPRTIIKIASGNAVGGSIKTAVFVKQMGSYPVENGVRLTFSDSHGGDWDEWPADLRVRQMPFGCL